MNTRNGSGAISDYENIFIKFLSSLWESQAPILMGYAGCVITFVAPMVGIIYYQTKAFQNISIALMTYSLTNIAYGAFLSSVFAISLASVTVYTALTLFASFVDLVIDAKSKKQTLLPEFGM